MKNLNKILVIIQRSNGDVFLSLPLIKALYDFYDSPEIDLLVNDDTLPVAKLMPYINCVHLFSYQSKKDNRWSQETKIVKSIFRKYDLSINLTSSDRSILYAVLASKRSISNVEIDNKKSWWKKLLLSYYYYFDDTKHILRNNLKSLNLLKIPSKAILPSIKISDKVSTSIANKLSKKGIKDFIIFHPSAQYTYKIYPQHLRDELLVLLNNLGVPVLITGGSNKIDIEIKNSLQSLPNIIELIGETSLEEYFALTQLSLAYIGMDTLNMHIASSYNKRIFAIFGPTKLTMWSPWSNKLQKSATKNLPLQSYDNITVFQASLPCVACGNSGCDNKHGKSECLDLINPKLVFNEVQSWYQNARL